MANTTNLDLVKPAGTDHALISVLNSNSDKIDAFAGQTKDDIETLEEGLAYIVGNTNTTGNTLAVGKFVYVKGHSTIPNGLRKVTASISNNGNITTSNTSPDTAGGLNTLSAKITNIGAINRQKDSTSGTSYSFTIPSDLYNPFGYKYAVLMYSISSSSFVVIGIVLSDDGTSIKSYVISSTGDVRSLTFSRNSNVIGITANDTVWGGFTLLYIG